MDRTAFAKASQTAARWALYGSLAAVGALLVVGVFLLRFLRPDFTEDWDPSFDYTSRREVALLQEYLRINTSQPNARELDGARFLQHVFEQAGIPAHLEILAGQHANLWAVVEGRRREALVLHNHIDTDPVTNPADWQVGPYSGALDGGYIYGRGAYDMKGIAIAQLMAMLALKESGRVPERSVVFLATGSEEVGSDLGTKWILRQHPELAERFWAFLTEGGVIEATSVEDIKYWGIEFVQKRLVDIELCADDRESLESLRKELWEEREKGGFEVRLTPEAETFLQPYAKTRDRAYFREVLGDLERLRFDPVQFNALPVFLRSFVRDEATAWPVEPRPDGTFAMRVRFLLLPGSSFEAARQRILPDWRLAPFRWTVRDEGGASQGSALDHDAYRALAEELRRAYPRADIGPYFLTTAATDARFTRAVGVPSYGFSPFVIYVTDTNRVGLPNERLRLSSYLAGVEIYRRVVERLAG